MIKSNRSPRDQGILAAVDGAAASSCQKAPSNPSSSSCRHACQKQKSKQLARLTIYEVLKLTSSPSPSSPFPSWIRQLAGWQSIYTRNSPAGRPHQLSEGAAEIVDATIHILLLSCWLTYVAAAAAVNVCCSNAWIE